MAASLRSVLLSTIPPATGRRGARRRRQRRGGVAGNGTVGRRFACYTPPGLCATVNELAGLDMGAARAGDGRHPLPCGRKQHYLALRNGKVAVSRTSSSGAFSADTQVRAARAGGQRSPALIRQTTVRWLSERRRFLRCYKYLLNEAACGAFIRRAGEGIPLIKAYLPATSLSDVRLPGATPFHHRTATFRLAPYRRLRSLCAGDMPSPPVATGPSLRSLRSTSCTRWAGSLVLLGNGLGLAVRTAFAFSVALRYLVWYTGWLRSRLLFLAWDISFAGSRRCGRFAPATYPSVLRARRRRACRLPLSRCTSHLCMGATDGAPGAQHPQRHRRERDGISMMLCYLFHLVLIHLLSIMPLSGLPTAAPLNMTRQQARTPGSGAVPAAC